MQKKRVIDAADVLALLGVALIVAGVATFDWRVALIVGGVALVIMALLAVLARQNRPE